MNLSDIEFNRINELICRMYIPGDSHFVRKRIMEVISDLIPYDFGDFCLANVNDDESFEIVDPVYISRFGDMFQKDFEAAYQEKYSSFDYTKWYINKEKSVAFIESELIDKEARVNTVFYKELLEPRGLIYSLGCYLIAKDSLEVLGAIALYRNKRRTDFDYRDLEIMNILLPHITQSMENCVRANPVRMSRTDMVLTDTYGLTKRELDVVRELKKGLTNEEIGKTLNLSVNTVKKHLYNIFGKMEVSSRTKLIKKIEKIK